MAAPEHFRFDRLMTSASQVHYTIQKMIRSVQMAAIDVTIAYHRKELLVAVALEFRRDQATVGIQVVQQETLPGRIIDIEAGVLRDVLAATATHMAFINASVTIRRVLALACNRSSELIEEEL